MATETFHPRALKVFLDDEREAPEGWVHVRWSQEAIYLLQTGLVSELSLGHDLGDDSRGASYDVIVWIEEKVVTTDFVPPTIFLHTANSSAAQRMQFGVDTIQKLVDDRSKHARFAESEASRRLARLGGSSPDLKAAPRRRIHPDLGN